MDRGAPMMLDHQRTNAMVPKKQCCGKPHQTTAYYQDWDFEGITAGHGWHINKNINHLETTSTKTVGNGRICI
jgi:hypothetical protein